METKINNIVFEYASPILRGDSYEATDEPVQSSDNSDATKYIRKSNKEFEFTAAFTSEDREDKLKQLLDLASKRDLVTVTQYETYDNIAILSISEPNRYENIISLTISCRQLSVISFKTLQEPLAEVKSVTSQKKGKNKKSTNSKKGKSKGKAKTKSQTVTPGTYPPPWLKT